MSDDTISRKATIDAMESVDWYHIENGEMVHGANSTEHQAWYKAEDVYKVLNEMPSAELATNLQPCNQDDLISKQEVINNVRKIILGFFSDADGVMTDTEKTLLSVNKAVCNGVRELPSAQPEIIRCKECKWWGYDDDYGVVRMCHAAKHNYVSPHWNVFICRTYKGDYYCADAERRTR